MEPLTISHQTLNQSSVDNSHSNSQVFILTRQEQLLLQFLIKKAWALWLSG